MSKLAIDVVVLPDQKMAEKSVEVSTLQFKKTNNSKILLDSKNCLPHISLVMGVIKKSDLEEASRIIDEVTSEIKNLNLRAEKYRKNVTPKGNVISDFVIEKRDDLYLIHEKLIKQLKHLLVYKDATVDMFYAPPAVENTTPSWVEGFLEHSSFENYDPHITLGFGQIENVETPIQFKSDTIAICHLGNYCTCRKILHKASFGK